MQSYNLDRFVLAPVLVVFGLFAIIAYDVRIASSPLVIYSSFILLAFALGASLASFMGAMVERLPLGEPTNTPSHCACGRSLKLWENIPIIGWLSLRITHRGYTRCCDTKLPSWYFLLESITGFAYASLATFFIVNDVFNPFILASTALVVLVIVFLVSDYRNIASHNYSDEKRK